ncbi:hypothetical protein JX266_005854 [Neoarthrinium moseri]|uniref:uncharacterized protein n=1 Tax=Neoarthrinium moseri TaxID=1658444 RepID=UPI001FDC47E4|nr:uncharacterized protein JN550_002112 [Neoarthrinium moseri]KAI1848141.1 hypothetical protein JX266_005854 [Neoarthrinium moseri]KAI1875826.1 hypothetical protein JN550_002112 [Neoarthrinium moseri]
MALGLPTTKLPGFRPKLGKRNHSAGSSISSMENSEKKPRESNADNGSRNATSAQLGSQLFKIPCEIRNIIYDHALNRTVRDQHIYHENGRLYHARCVMTANDEEPDFIQKQMDRLLGSTPVDGFNNDRMKMWFSRLTGEEWDHRHWRCYLQRRGPISKFEETGWMSMMLACKRMYPEVQTAILEFHKFHINDLTSIHLFMVLRPPLMLSQVRHLDLTINVSYYEYSPFVKDDHTLSNSRILAIQNVLHNLTCIHTLRISFDTCSRRVWREVPEKALLKRLDMLQVLREFTVELPPELSERNRSLPNQLVKGGDFKIVRRPMWRYWAWPPLRGNVQRIEWLTSEQDGQEYGFRTEDQTIWCKKNPYAGSDVEGHSASLDY